MFVWTFHDMLEAIVLGIGGILLLLCVMVILIENIEDKIKKKRGKKE